MRYLLLLLVSLAVAACGVEGENVDSHRGQYAIRCSVTLPDSQVIGRFGRRHAAVLYSLELERGDFIQVKRAIALCRGVA